MKILTAILISLCLAAPAMAAPPSHAPAHGYRNKAAKHRGYTGAEWERDYGVLRGRCNTDDVLAVLGGVAGGVIGNRTASGDNRTLGTIAGAVIGAVLGHELGEAIDGADQRCLGHSLEVGRLNQAVRWTSPHTGVAHTLTPLRDLANGCREFSYRVGERKARVLRGCRNAEAAWVIRRE